MASDQDQDQDHENIKAISTWAPPQIFMPSFYSFIFLLLSVLFIPLVVEQITGVRRYLGAATGHYEGGNGHCGKEGSGESDLLPARS